MPAHAAWQNPLHRIVVLAALLLLLLGAGREHIPVVPSRADKAPQDRYAPSDSLETLRAFTSTVRFGGPRRPFLSSSGASHGPYSTHKCIGGSDIAPSLSAAAQTRCHFKNVCLTLLPTLLANNTNVEATSVRLEYFRPPELERLDVPVQWNMRFEQTKSWTRLGRDSAVVPEIKFTPIPSHYKWSEAKVAVASESFWPENYGHCGSELDFKIFTDSSSPSARGRLFPDLSSVQALLHRASLDEGPPGDPASGVQGTGMVGGARLLARDGGRVCVARSRHHDRGGRHVLGHRRPRLLRATPGRIEDAWDGIPV